MDVTVKPGPILDGVAPHMREPFHVYSKSKTKPVDVAAELKDSGAEIPRKLLPQSAATSTGFVLDLL